MNIVDIDVTSPLKGLLSTSLLPLKGEAASVNIQHWYKFPASRILIVSWLNDALQVTKLIQTTSLAVSSREEIEGAINRMSLDHSTTYLVDIHREKVLAEAFYSENREFAYKIKTAYAGDWSYSPVVHKVPVTIANVQDSMVTLVMDEEGHLYSFYSFSEILYPFVYGQSLSRFLLQPVPAIVQTIFGKKLATDLLAVHGGFKPISNDNRIVYTGWSYQTRENPKKLPKACIAHLVAMGEAPFGKSEEPPKVTSKPIVQDGVVSLSELLDGWVPPGTKFPVMVTVDMEIGLPDLNALIASITLTEPNKMVVALDTDKFPDMTKGMIEEAKEEIDDILGTFFPNVQILFYG